MPGSVVAVHARAGDEVARGDVLLVLESMKMELQITAPHDGRVAALHVAAGDQVPLDSVLASMESAP
jgi:acetyl-CoA/propionyl-CoA carboxylase biotin carboxyl carrier protein